MFVCLYSNVNCGSLFCNLQVFDLTQIAFPYNPAIASPIYFYRLYTAPSSSSRHTCTSGSYHLDGNPGFPDIGYVPDGASCGSSQVRAAHFVIQLKNRMKRKFTVKRRANNHLNPFPQQLINTVLKNKKVSFS